ncbi:MAG: CmcI family methyltransferase, partial [Candidatus Omnitrophota bacterium]
MKKEKINKLRNLLFEQVHIQRVYVNARLKERITEQFHRLYYDSRSFGETWYNTFWLGAKTFKLPLDLWVYQEILYSLKPDMIIETGTSYGGSALFLASICDLLNNGRIITIDIEQRKDAPRHKRIKYILGSSISNDIVKNLRSIIKRKDKVMVILDSDHHKDHVLKEIEIYSKFVT